MRKRCVNLLNLKKQKKYASKVAETLEKAGVRTRIDFSDNTIGKKIRMHRKMRPAYMLIIGEEESKKKTVAIRNRAGEQRNDVTLNDFVKEILEEIKNPSAELNIVLS